MEDGFEQVSWNFECLTTDVKYINILNNISNFEVLCLVKMTQLFWKHSGWTITTRWWQWGEETMNLYSEAFIISINIADSSAKSIRNLIFKCTLVFRSKCTQAWQTCFYITLSTMINIIANPVHYLDV